MATTSLLPKSIPPFFTNQTSISSARNTNVSFLSNQTTRQPHSHSSTTSFQTNAKKKNGWLDAFDTGEDPDMEYGSQYSSGKQSEDPRPPENPDNPYGFLKFPPGFMPEVASLGLKIRGDVRRCCCVVSGGVYENLLFFPTIQLLKDRYPGVQVDILSSARGKQTYEMNKNVRWADVYDPDDFIEPAEYLDLLGLIKNRYYDMMLSTKLAGLGHASFLFMSTASQTASYIYPNVNAAGAGLLLSETFTPDRLNLSEGGYNMYHQMTDWLARPGRNVPTQVIPPLKVSISRKLKDIVAAKYKNAGVEKGKYIVIHGIQSDSKASMQSRGDPDSLLPLHLWREITSSIRGVKPLYVIPHEKERENVEEIIGDDTNMIFITTPGQLAALINDSVGVISTNTAAVHLALAREKPCVALFGSEEKAKLFLPNVDNNKCIIASSKTGKLADIDTNAVKNAVQIFEMPLVLA
ncbi:photosynthetic NDH subunit of subcomplex B 1, chloroplastic [Tanacetum coccineum]